MNVKIDSLSAEALLKILQELPPSRRVKNQVKRLEAAMKHAEALRTHKEDRRFQAFLHGGPPRLVGRRRAHAADLRGSGQVRAPAEEKKEVLDTGP